MKKKIFYVIVLGLLAAMLFAIFSQPGLDDFDTQFTEVTRVRNENNTGPVQRVYIVTVDQVNKEEMQLYGQLMPYAKLGNTKVYFFDESKPYPKSAQLRDLNFDPEFNINCLAKYEKRFGFEGVLMNPFQ